MKTVIYARYSSQLQNSRSIEDQVAVCRERASREGWSIVDIFTDYAISGAAGIGEDQRPGLAAMLTRVRKGGVDQVLAESTDRLARHQGDSHTIREQLAFHNTRFFTLTDGLVTEINGTIKGLMDAQFRRELGAKISRGQRGSVAAGRSPVGIAYGYRTANRMDESGRPIRGLREIEDAQAETVRRIFEEFASGRSARDIAAGLNADGVPGPRGSHWRASTINGDGARGNGILRNELYIGRLVHNRTSKVTEPTTRTVRIRPNPVEEHAVKEVAHLRIVSDELWRAVEERRGSYSGVKLHRTVRPRRMLSGLGVCGNCGQGWIVIGSEKWGCTKHKADGSCSNNRQITTGEYERRVLEGLTGQMLDPSLIEIYVHEYEAEYARRASKMRQDETRLRRQLGDVRSRVDRLIDALSKGGAAFPEVRDAIASLRVEHDGLRQRLTNFEAVPAIIERPNLTDDYRRQVAKLSLALADPDARTEAVPALRKLIDRIVVTPNLAGRGVALEIHGDLGSILALADENGIAGERLFVMERVKGIEPSS